MTDMALALITFGALLCLFSMLLGNGFGKEVRPP